jgi:hypothetical protein
MAKKRNPSKQHYINTAWLALKQRGFESRAGFCARWERQTGRAAGFPASIVPDGLPTARARFAWYQARGYALRAGTRPQPGDIVFKVRPVDGKAGHEGIMLTVDLVGENSSAHVGDTDREARGVRPIRAFPSCRVVRLPFGS